MKSKGPLANLSEQQLLRRFNELVHQDQQRTAHLLAAIAEIDQRKLWAKHGCPSMFAFCVERFHMSESVTAKRIWAARTARRFPLVLHMVARGELHLSAVVQLAKHLTDDNHRVVLGRAKHKTSREIDLLVAELAPRPDAPSRIRALPRRAGPVVRSQSEATPASLRAPGSAEHEQPSAAGAVAGPAAPKLPRPHKQIVALALRRYKIEITVDQETHDKLRMLEDLLAHQSPAADPATIVSRAIERLLAETLKKKAAVTYQARPGGRHRAKAGTQRT